MLFSGSDTEGQIGLESAYGSAATATLQLPLVSANVNEVPQMNKSRALVGDRFQPPSRRGMSLVKGSMTIEMNPDILPTWCWLACGAEAAPAAVVGHSGAYDHVFTPVPNGTALPSFTLILDKGVDVFTFTGCKISSVKITVTSSDLMTWAIEFTGQQELLTGSLASLSLSTKAPFTYAGLLAKVGDAGTVADTATDYVESADITYDNKLDQDRFRAIGQSYTGEVEANGCSMVMSLKCDLSDDVNTLRETYGKTALPIAVQVEYDNSEEIGSSTTNYKLIVDMLYGSLPPFEEDIPGPDRLSVSFDIEASAGANGTVQFTVRDGNNAKVAA
jgi:hypothetical protein